MTLVTSDVAVIAGLVWLQRAFLVLPPAPPHQIAAPVVLSVLTACLWRWYDLRGDRLYLLLARSVGFAVTNGAGLLLWRLVTAQASTVGACLWLAAAGACAMGTIRVAQLAARTAWPDRPMELLRWVAIAGATIALMRVFVTADFIGSGDARWYTIMLADFAQQWRAGVFPVWIGQSEWAFNGAISPLRLAPAFQHLGGLVDLATAHALGHAALKNATLIASALAGGMTAYGCLRAMLPHRPWLAVLLAWLWMASPGVLAPPLVGDQYMTFLTPPFVALVLYGCWRTWTRDDGWSRRMLTAGLAGSLLCHPPIALWTGVFAAVNYLAKIVIRGSWREEPRRAAAMSLGLLILGSFPILSVLSLDRLKPEPASAQFVAKIIRDQFPANFQPITVHGNTLAMYQLGYAAIGALALILVLTLALRTRHALPFVIGALLVAPFTLPMPWLTDRIWQGLPSWFVTINNVWPMQRLFLIWSGVIFFGVAAIATDPRVVRRRSMCLLIVGALLAGGLWSWHEAAKLATVAGWSRAPAPEAETVFAPHNVVLTRYAYSTFPRTPAYVSHGYMDPLLENRLLDPKTFKIIADNASAAAPESHSGDALTPQTRLLQEGHFTAANDNNSDIHSLSPSIELQPDTRYALRLDFTEPDQSGVLQVLHDRLTREYYLPDSGVGLHLEGTSRAFGSGPLNSRIISLYVPGNGGAIRPRLQYVTPRRPADAFSFARFRLFSFQPAQLPVFVESWIPYRAQVRADTAAWLETPRVWQSQWTARVNGRPVAVQPSPENLVMVAVEAGKSQVTLEFRPQWWLSAAYWITLSGWVILLADGLRRVIRTITNAPADGEI